MKNYFTFFSHFAICLILSLNILIVNGQRTSAIYKVYPITINSKPISPLIYGNFLELGFGRQIEGMWSEKLFNASFEIISPYKWATWDWLSRTAEDDLRTEPWWHSGYEECHWYSIQEDGLEQEMSYSRYSGFYHGLQAAMLDNSQGKSAAFIAQDGIWLNKGIDCTFKGYIKNNPVKNSSLVQRDRLTSTPPVRVTIGLYPLKDFSNPIDEKTIIVDGGFFEEYSIKLLNNNFEGIATFAVSVEAGTSASFDGFNLMPTDNIKGWRKDVIETLKNIHVPILRFPGGCFASFYNWRTAIGPRADRIPVNSEYWGGLEENNVGVAEFVEMCRMTGSEPFYCINLLTGTPQDAADLVAYTNSSSSCRMSELRRSHGYQDPLTIKYWELDNETNRRFGYEEYAKRCVEFSKAMKAIDPTIQIVMVGYSRFKPFLKEMLEISGQYVDLITDRSGNELILKQDLAIIADFNGSNNTNIKLCNTEWLAGRAGTRRPDGRRTFPETQPGLTRQQSQITWNYAMNLAAQLLIFQRLGGDFLFSNFNNLCNTWGQNIIECPKDTVFISAAGRVFELMSRSNSAWVLKMDTVNKIDGVFIQATANAEKNEMIIYMLNYLPSSHGVTLDLTSCNSNSKEAIIRTIYSNEPLSSNNSNNPKQISSSEHRIKIRNPKSPIIDLLPYSLTEVKLSVLLTM